MTDTPEQPHASVRVMGTQSYSPQPPLSAGASYANIGPSTMTPPTVQDIVVPRIIIGKAIRAISSVRPTYHAT